MRDVKQMQSFYIERIRNRKAKKLKAGRSSTIRLIKGQLLNLDSAQPYETDVYKNIDAIYELRKMQIPPLPETS